MKTRPNMGTDPGRNDIIQALPIVGISLPEENCTRSYVDLKR